MIERQNAAQLADVRKSFGPTYAVRGVSLTIRAGRIHALLGHNGAGKSTLVKMLSGAIAPDSGSVHIGDRRLPPRPSDALRLGVRPIYQHRTLMPNLSVADNIVMFDRRGVIRRRHDAVALARHKLATLGCAVDPDRLVRTLAVGEAQEVEIARALADDVKLLILDEPTASLSAKEMRRLEQVMFEIRRLGVGLLLVSHDLEYVKSVADWITVMRDGQVIVSAPAVDVSREQIVATMLGPAGTEACAPTTSPSAGSGPSSLLLELDHVSGAILREVNLAVRPGEILGVTGSLGSGLEELAEVVAGVRRPTAGTICWQGARVALRSPRDALRRGIAYLPDDRLGKGLWTNLSPADQIELGQLAVSRGLLTHRRQGRRRAAALARRVGLRPAALDRMVSQLSGGNQQKVLAARCLRTEPWLLVAHEPTIGVDVVAREAIHDLFRELASSGTSVVILSSDAQEIVDAAGRAVVLRNGTVVLRCDTFDEHTLVAAALGDQRGQQ